MSSYSDWKFHKVTVTHFCVNEDLPIVFMDPHDTPYILLYSHIHYSM